MKKVHLISQAVISINDKAVKTLLMAIYHQAYDDFKNNADVPDKEMLYGWLLNEGRTGFAPFLKKEEVKKKLDEHLYKRGMVGCFKTGTNSREEQD